MPSEKRLISDVDDESQSEHDVSKRTANVNDYEHACTKRSAKKLRPYSRTIKNGLSQGMALQGRTILILSSAALGENPF